MQNQSVAVLTCFNSSPKCLIRVRVQGAPQNPELCSLTLRKPREKFADVRGVWNTLRKNKVYEWIQLPRAE